MKDVFKRKSCEKFSWGFDWKCSKKINKRYWRKKVKADLKQNLHKCYTNQDKCEDY